MSNLSAIEWIAERSEATPGLWNRRYSTISDNFAALNSNLTFDASGGTFSLSSNLSIGADLWVRGSVLVGEAPSVITRAELKLVASSAVSDYILFEDSSAAKSSYLLGSRVGGTADGLNLWDVSGDTMIVGFSKQSVRFYQQVVAPILDTGGEVYNVKAYGAKGDNSTDDHASITLASSLASRGGTVLFPSGATYLISAAIDFGGFRGTVFYGRGSSIRQTTTNANLFTGDNAENVTFDSLRLVGTGTATGAGNDGAGIATSDSTNISVQYCSFESYGGMGVYVGRARRFAIIGSHFSSGQPSTNMGDAADIYVILNSEKGLILNNYCDGGGSQNSQGILISNGARHILVHGNVVRNKRQHGILTYNNQVLATEEPDSALTRNEFITIANNNVSLCSWVPIYVNNSVNVRVLGNVASEGGPGDSGIEGNIFCTNGINVLIEGNSCYSGRMGIKVDVSGTTGRQVAVVGNSISSMSQQGIYVVNVNRNLSDVVVSNNMIERTISHGIQVYGGSANTVYNITLTGNSVRSSTAEGIRLDRVERAQVADNRVAGGTVGIDLNAIADVDVSGNVILGASGQGILADNGATRFLIHENISRSNDRGIHVVGASNYRVFNNDTSNNATAGFAESGSSNSIRFDLAPIVAADGAALRPSVGFTSEVSLGMYRSGASTIGLSYGTLSFGGLNGVGDIAAVDFNGYAKIFGNLWAGGEVSLDFAARSNSATAVVARMTGNYFAPISVSALTLGTPDLPWRSLHVASGVSVGLGGTLIPAISSMSSKVGAFIVQPSASSFTGIAWAAAGIGDIILCGPYQSAAASSISSGLVAHSHVTVAGQIEFRLSNVSTLVQNQSAQTWVFTRIRPF